MPPPEEPRRLEDLLDAAGRAVQPTAFGWDTLRGRLAMTPQQRPQGLRRWATLPLGVAAAASVVLALWLGLAPEQTAQAGPIEVRRQGIDLTILSAGETEGETLYMPVIGQSSRRGDRKLTGQALVRDRRLVLNLRRGDNIVRFTDVAASIDPTSVRFESLTDPGGTHVVEQSFEYDLATADTLLRRYLDRDITCVGKDGAERTGRLLSFDGEYIMLTSAPRGVEKATGTESLSRRALKALKLGELPAGLTTRPTLVWRLRTRTPGRHETVLGYVCGLLSWQADYVILVRPGRGQEPDQLDVSGWVTIENTSGATYSEAGLRLLAGDINRLPDPWARAEKLLVLLDNAEELGEDGAPIQFPPGSQVKRVEFSEKSFFEYHLYALSDPSTIRDRQLKQLRLLARKDIKATRRYVFDATAVDRHLLIELIAKNEKDNHLGLPLPKGRVTLEQRDADGETAVIGRTKIEHTAVKEKLELPYAHAFDVVGEHREVGFEFVWFRHYRTTYEIRVRNHKPEPVQVRAFARRLDRADTLREATMPHHRKDAQTLYFDFRLDANAEQTIRYTLATQE